MMAKIKKMRAKKKPKTKAKAKAKENPQTKTKTKTKKIQMVLPPPTIIRIKIIKWLKIILKKLTHLTTKLSPHVKQRKSTITNVMI